MGSFSNHNENFLRELIIDEATALGFDDCGFSKADFMGEHAELMESWLEKGFQGDMSYLERNKDKRYDPRKLVENTKTIVSVTQNYFPSETISNKDNYKISKYAYGKDYHHVIRTKLQKILQKIEEYSVPFEARAFTDSAPVLDRAWAERSGLGFIGKNTCLIHPRKGSFFFIGHLFLPFSLEENPVKSSDYCGTCSRCIDACPTGALVAPHQLDAQRCISYLTIEHKGELPSDLKTRFNDWIFGCDICQDVCPWNRFAKPHQEPLFLLSEGLKKLNKETWNNLTKDQYNKIFKGSAVQRTKYDGLKRNINFIKDPDSTSKTE
ncbi:MAG: tRNA epoxyqueuosine(34) reductase QueG [Bacteroidetes bacterium HGW-Bacteroidetes-1]|jgi:epoxyqueuosine reductase|nr:MAG: tRNA epoxyqueuosine(34) reductase QueG [Bacteroidetes bacterium HGW-Bacteroidetes-1]